MTKVSVVIPTHNRPDALARALASVLAQTEGSFEVFVIDDGSHDDAAAEVVRACHDSRVNYVPLPVSRGPAGARNEGIGRAQAPFVAFLDDDDEWLPEKLQKQLPLLEAGGPNLGGIYTARITIDRIAGTTATTRSGGERFDPNGGRNVVTTSSVLVKRECFGAVGLFDEGLFGCEDYDMWIRIANVFDFRYLDEPLVRYFVHSGGITYAHHRRVHAQEKLLSKHRRIFESSPRELCLLYLGIGTRYYLLGQTWSAWKAFAQAWRAWPLEPRVYWAFVRSTLLWPRGGVAREVR